MGHNVQAFIGKKETLHRITEKYQNSKPVLLEQGFYLLPLLDEFYDAIPDETDPDLPANDEFLYFSKKIGKLLNDFSDETGLVYFETEYFGGEGSQGAVSAKSGKLIFGPKYGDQSINLALRAVGADKKAERDEFDALGLHRYRDNEDWIDQPDYSKL